MPSVSLSHDIDALEKTLDSFSRKQLPFATSKALNQTVFHVSQSLRGLIPKQIDRPIPFTVSGVQYEGRATKRNQVATVGIEAKRDAYLQWQIDGGVRPPKRVAHTVPTGRNMALNKFGNVTKARLKGAAMRLDTTGAQSTFAGKPKGHPSAKEGIWERRGRKGRDRIRQLLHFEPQARYKPRLRWFPTAELEVRKTFAPILNRVLEDVVAKEHARQLARAQKGPR